MKTLAVSLSVALSLGAAAPAFAQDAAPATAPEAAAELPVIRDTDGAMTCPQMSEEAAQLSQTMGGEPKGGLFSALGGVARAGAAMVIPGAGLVLAGADAVNRPERERKEAEARAVENRWYYLNGLFAGKGCQEQAEAAAAAAAGTAPAAPATPGN
jgi:hypothetical protein